MAEQHATPVTRPGLHVVTGAVTAPAGNGDDPVTAGAVVPMRAAERAGNAVRHWAGSAGQLWLHPGRAVREMLCGDPDSTAEHWRYVTSREWIPRELHGTRAGKVITVLGFAYHVLIAVPLDKSFQAAEFTVRRMRRIAQRPLRLLGLLLVIVVILLIVI